MIEIDQETLETLIDENVGHASETVISSGEQPPRLKTPYCRQRRDSKTYVSKQKSFTRKRSQGRYDSRRELNNNGEISVDASNVRSFPAGSVEAFKNDGESDSGYSSSMSTSISLSDEIEAPKGLILENGSNTDIEGDELSSSGNDQVRKRSADHPIMNESTANAALHRNANKIEERLDSLIHGVTPGIENLDLNRECALETDVHSQAASVSYDLDEPGSASFKLIHHESVATVQENTKELPESFAMSPFRLQKTPALDDSALSRTKMGRKPGLLRRRTTLVSFRPPKQMAVQEGESDIVEMDEAGFLQMLTDFKSLKTQLLKLKRELQEVGTVPLSYRRLLLGARTQKIFTKYACITG